MIERLTGNCYYKTREKVQRGIKYNEMNEKEMPRRPHYTIIPYNDILEGENDQEAKKEVSACRGRVISMI